MDYGTKVRLTTDNYSFPVGERGKVNAILGDSLGRVRVEIDRTECWLWVHPNEVEVID